MEKKKVIDKVLETCRMAMLNGIPVIFIRTESEIILKRIIYHPDNHLITPLWNNKEAKRAPFFKGETLPENKDRIINYKWVDGSTTEFSLSDAAAIEYPMLWIIAVRENTESRKQTYASIKTYVEEYESTIDKADYDTRNSSMMILYGRELPEDYPACLAHYTEIIDISIPEKHEVLNIVEEYTGQCEAFFDLDFKASLATRMMGFTLEEVELCMRQVSVYAEMLEESFRFHNSRPTASDREIHKKEIRQKAEEIIAQRKKKKNVGGILELCETNGRIGGMDNLKKWIGQYIYPLMRHYDVYEKRVGIAACKGILMCGIPGCGKSEAAKYIAQLLNFPLLRMDMSRMMSRFLGDSEKQFVQALRLAEAVSPCVLFLDEIEKCFAGGGSDDEGGTLQRIIAQLLTWMQDKTKPVFIYATANSTGQLPDALFRKGRFDALYGVYLPTEEECIDILLQSMQKFDKTVRENNSTQDGLFALDWHNEEDIRKWKEDLRDLLYILTHTGEQTTRLVIGSDLHELVKNALRSFIETEKETRADGQIIHRLVQTTDKTPLRIEQTQWITHLKEEIGQSDFHVYGDDEENISMTAVRYCRLLRRKFIPTSKNPLFRFEDYHSDRYKAIQEYKENPHTEDKETKPAPILEKREPTPDAAAYDRAVYELLWQRINDVAFDVEKMEREKIFAQ